MNCSPPRFGEGLGEGFLLARHGCREAFQRSRADCLGRPQPLRVEGATRFQLAVALARESWLGHNPDSANFANRERFVTPDNVAVAYRREVFDRVGLFDESFDACEDV